jgi:peptidoglycan/LPS O-acetylase OafA/YrhL
MADSDQVMNATIFTKIFYLLTSLYHPAVMVFFVLSSYFVGGSVLGAIKKGRFS